MPKYGQKQEISKNRHVIYQSIGNLIQITISAWIKTWNSVTAHILDYFKHQIMCPKSQILDNLGPYETSVGQYETSICPYETSLGPYEISLGPFETYLGPQEAFLCPYEISICPYDTSF